VALGIAVGVTVAVGIAVDVAVGVGVTAAVGVGVGVSSPDTNATENSSVARFADPYEDTMNRYVVPPTTGTTTRDCDVPG